MNSSGVSGIIALHAWSIGRALEREEQRSCVELVDGEHVELDHGHDAEVAAAAQRPEQVGMSIG